MAATGFTPISLYYSTTASAVPLAANLANGELALNTADMKLYAKNSSGVVTLLSSSSGATGTVSSVAVSGGTTGLTTSGGPITTSGTITLAGTLATTNGGTGLTSFTSGGVVYASSTSALATGSALQFDGTNLGVGVTPSAWSGLKGFQVGRATLGGSISEGAWLSSNAFYDGANWVYLTTSQATQYRQLSGVQSWHVATSGTAGTAVSFTQAMTLGSSGNWTLGGTTEYGRVTIFPASNPTTPTTANQINIGENSQNVGYRLQLGYMLTGGTTWQGSIQAFAASSATNLILNGDGGNVSVGATTNPNSRKLSVNGIVSVQDGTTERAFIYYTGSATQWVSVNTPQQFWVNGAQRFVYGTSGQFGIGATPDYGTAGQVLTSGGSGAAPTWAAASGGTTMLFTAFSSTGETMYAGSGY